MIKVPVSVTASVSQKCLFLDSLCRHIALSGYYDYQVSDEEYQQRKREINDIAIRRQYMNILENDDASDAGGSSDTRSALAPRGVWKDVPVTRLK